MDQLYREAILDHYKYPRHKGHLDDPDVSYHDHNPFCGDEITIDLKVEDGIVVDAAFDGHGCAISQAAASLLTEEIKGKTLAELKAFPAERLLELVGVPLSMARVKCALLSLKVLKAGAYGIPDPDTMRGHE